MDLIKELSRKSNKNLVKFTVLLAAWNRAHPRARITIPTVLKRVKLLQDMGLVEIVKYWARVTPLGSFHPGQVDVRKSSIRLLTCED
ncbi:MAG: hypothetical protein ACFFBD_08030 [Candidatus Hodarchaeota archaeon]